MMSHCGRKTTGRRDVRVRCEVSVETFWNDDHPTGLFAPRKEKHHCKIWQTNTDQGVVRPYLFRTLCHFESRKSSGRKWLCTDLLLHQLTLLNFLFWAQTNLYAFIFLCACHRFCTFVHISVNKVTTLRPCLCVQPRGFVAVFRICWFSVCFLFRHSEFLQVRVSGAPFCPAIPANDGTNRIWGQMFSILKGWGVQLANNFRPSARENPRNSVPNDAKLKWQIVLRRG